MMNLRLEGKDSSWQCGGREPVKLNMSPDNYCSFGQSSSIVRKKKKLSSGLPSACSSFLPNDNGVCAIMLFLSLWEVFKQIVRQPCLVDHFVDILVLEMISLHVMQVCSFKEKGSRINCLLCVDC